MMLIIADESPRLAVDYLIEHTNKNFAFKQLIELCQLLAGCGITDEMKPIKQGKEIMLWIKQNSWWARSYFAYLFDWCRDNIVMHPKTILKIANIDWDFYIYTTKCDHNPVATAIFRYKQGYECKYESNSELPIDIATKEYKKYLDWKFKKDEV